MRGTESPNLHRDRWIKGLLENGLEFDLEILEICAEDESNEAEKRWITHYRQIGSALTNLTDGGDGISGFKWQEGSNRGSATKGRKKSEGFGAKVSTGLKQYLADHPEAVEARRQRAHELRLGYAMITPEAQEKSRRSRQTPEHKALRSALSSRPENIARLRRIAAERDSIKVSCLICRRELVRSRFASHQAAHHRRGELMLNNDPGLLQVN